VVIEKGELGRHKQVRICAPSQIPTVIDDLLP
ncbi:MAG: YggU family protein, partial [Vibrio sp.]